LSSSAHAPVTTRMTFLLSLRWACGAALLLGEVVLLSVRFDTASLMNEPAAWARLVGATPDLARIGLLAIGFLAALGGATLWKELWHAGSPVPSRYPWWAFLLGHFAVLAIFTELTGVVLEGDLGHKSSMSYAWVSAWFVSGTATVLLWALALLPAAVWRRLLRSGWPMALLSVVIGLAGWAAGLAARQLWEPLGAATLSVVRILLQPLLADRLVCDPATRVIGTEDFAACIAPQCSGYEGMGLMIVVMGAYLWLFRRHLRFPAALVMLPLGTAAVWLLNAFRIAALIVLGDCGWREVALGGFHSQAGWLAFNAVALGLMASTGRISWLSAAAPSRGTRRENPTIAYLGPFMAALLAMMIGRAFSSDFDWFYPLRVVAVAATLWFCRRSYAELRGPWSWQAVGFGVAVFGLWVVVVPWFTPMDAGWPAKLTNLPLWGQFAWLAVRVVGHVLAVPLAEELFFRGYLLRRLTTARFLSVPPDQFSWLSFAVTSVAFGLLHGQAWLAGTLAGMAFALALRRRGQLLDAVVAHATANGLLAVYVLTTGKWGMWS
jgi:exosortase E/protease (VPEID-CTERM system)